MKRFASTVAVVGMFFIFMVSADSFARKESEGWRSVNNEVFLNTKSIARLSDETVSLWMKIVPEKGGAVFSETEQQLKEKGKDPRTYGYTGVLCEIDCVNHQYREVSKIFYKKDTNIIHSLNDSAASWQRISPWSVFHDVHVDVCDHAALW